MKSENHASALRLQNGSFFFPLLESHRNQRFSRPSERLPCILHLDFLFEAGGFHFILFFFFLFFPNLGFLTAEASMLIFFFLFLASYIPLNMWLLH
jgi:hypothetical protein